MCDYTELDDAICRHIDEGKGHPTNSDGLSALALLAARRNGTGATVGWRVVDRRIQVMRKAGRLVLERRGGSGSRWRVVHNTGNKPRGEATSA